MCQMYYIIYKEDSSGFNINARYLWDITLNIGVDASTDNIEN
jgi:hypothetical protein